MHSPLVDADTKYLCPNSEPLEWFREGFASPNGDEPYWEGRRKFVDIDAMKSAPPPVLLFAGWYDFFCSEQLHDFQELCRRSDDCRLVVGPYTHWHVLAMQPKLHRSLFDFFDRHLLKEPGVKSLAPVDVFSMGDGMGWRQFVSWPPPDTPTKVFALAREKGTNDLIVDVDNSSISEESEVSYVYSPSDPTPQIGGATFNPSNCGRLDQREIESRDDVLIFTSKPLDQPLHIAGEIKVRITVKSSVEGTDYVARACHVTPDGISRNMSDGILRRFDLQRGVRTQIEITLSPVMNRLAVGDRFRLQICSSAFPKYGRHLNTGESFHLEVDGNAMVSEQVLVLGGMEGCEVLVPVLPRGGRGENGVVN